MSSSPARAMAGGSPQCRYAAYPFGHLQPFSERYHCHHQFTEQYQRFSPPSYNTVSEGSVSPRLYQSAAGNQRDRHYAGYRELIFRRGLKMVRLLLRRSWKKSLKTATMTAALLLAIAIPSAAENPKNVWHGPRFARLADGWRQTFLAVSAWNANRSPNVVSKEDEASQRHLPENPTSIF